MHRPDSRPARLLLAAVLALALAMSGCARIPTSGPVETASERPRSDQPVEIQAVPPPPNADQQTIIQGFLHAMADTGGDYSIARQYLTPQAGATWNPTDVQIYNSDQPPQQVGDDIVLDAQVIGRLDKRGTYSASAGFPLHWEFKLVKQGTSWRISNPPAGLLLGSYFFSHTFTAVTLYFYDPGFRTLVPDVTYVPLNRRTPQFLVQQLALGASEWLRPAVASALPEGTSVSGPAADVSTDGVATVSLSRQIAALDARGRQLLARQIAVTLQANWSSPSPLMFLRLLQDGAPFAVSDQQANGLVPLSLYASAAPTAIDASQELFGIAGDRVVHVRRQGLGDPQAVPVAGPLGEAGQHVSGLAVSLRAEFVAAVLGGHQLVVTRLDDPAPPKPVLDAPGLLTPQYTRYDNLWALSVDHGTTTVQVYSQGQLQPVPAPALDGVAVSAFRISPDGTRMFVIGTRSDSKSPVYGMVLIQRAPALSLAAWRPMQLADERGNPLRLTSVAWRSATELIALGSLRDSTEVTAFEFGVDAPSVRAVGATRWDATQLASSPFNGVYLAAAIGASGALYRREDDRTWPRYTQESAFTAVTFPD